jgi:hypothetical protein
MIFVFIFNKPVTKCHGRVVNTPASLFMKTWVQILAQRLAILTEVFRDFPQSLQANAEIIP